MAAIPPVVAATINRVEIVVLPVLVLLAAVAKDLPRLIILLNRLTRLFEVTPVIILPLLFSATREKSREPLLLLVAVSLRRLSSNSLATAGTLISSPINSQFHPTVRDSYEPCHDCCGPVLVAGDLDVSGVAAISRVDGQLVGQDLVGGPKCHRDSAPGSNLPAAVDNSVLPVVSLLVVRLGDVKGVGIEHPQVD